MTAGRPTTYCKEMVDHIIARLVAGESVRKMCRDSHMPAASSVWKWLAEHEEFSERYARAKPIQADCFADRVHGVVEDVEEGVLEPHQGRVVMDGSKWLAAVSAPHKYSERHQVNHVHSGQVEHTHTHEERQKRIAELQAKTGRVIDSTAVDVTQVIENKE